MLCRASHLASVSDHCADHGLASITLKPHAARSPTPAPLKSAVGAGVNAAAHSTAGSSPIHAFHAPCATATGPAADFGDASPDAATRAECVVTGVPVPAAWAQQPVVQHAHPRGKPGLLHVSAAGAPGAAVAPMEATGDGQVAAKSYVVHADRPLVRRLLSASLCARVVPLLCCSCARSCSPQSHVDEHHCGKQRLICVQVRRVVATGTPGSPAADVFATWGRPQTAAEAQSVRTDRAAAAAALRQSYGTQIAQREALHAAYASTEDTWPYQPTHHPEGKFPYYNAPKYVAPHYINGPVKL